MRITAILAAAALPLMAAALTAPAHAYDNDEQALRVRDMIADPSVPLAWDRRHKRETFSIYLDDDRPHAARCGRHAYWDGDECVRKRRYR